MSPLTVAALLRDRRLRIIRIPLPAHGGANFAVLPFRCVTTNVSRYRHHKWRSRGMRLQHEDSQNVLDPGL